MHRFAILSMALVIFSACQSPQTRAGLGMVESIKGHLRINGKIASQGQKLFQYDQLETGKDSVVVLQLTDESQESFGMVELQSQAKLQLSNTMEKNMHLFLNSGNAWTKINSLKSDKHFVLHTPVTIAGVRGTQFYTFQEENFSGVCQCEGSLDYQHKEHDFVHRSSQDQIMIYREGVSFVLSPEETAALGWGHDHSVLVDSPLGKKQPEISAEDYQKIMDLMEKKTAEAKATI